MIPNTALLAVIEQIENEATSLGRQYIRLICEHSFLERDEHEADDLIKEWQQETKETRVPTLEEIVEYDFNKVLQDRAYVEQTMKCLMHRVPVANKSRSLLIGDRVKDEQPNTDDRSLLIDDVRNLNTEAVARTPDLGKKLLSLNCWDVVYLDHDLGAEQTGYDVLVWAITNSYLPKHVKLVTENKQGHRRMTQALLDAGYLQSVNDFTAT